VNTRHADVCFLLEGTYPYIAGGVSSWVHELIKDHRHLRFSIVAILANKEDMIRRYEIPENVIDIHHVYLHELQKGKRPSRMGNLLQDISPLITAVLKDGNLEAFARLLQTMHGYNVGSRLVLNSTQAWALLTQMYEEAMPSASFLDYFWSWRMMVGSLFAVLTGPLPTAGMYHVISTGYAGLLAARASVEKQRPVILTEHGIYTNERRIEISMADWMYEAPTRGLNIRTNQRELRDFWLDAFASFSKICYQACNGIITLYGGNQVLQKRDGAPLEKLRVVPNGIDYERFSAIEPDPAPRRPAVALIGRVVTIKDVKTFIRAAKVLRSHMPDVEALVIGPTEEDPTYFQECLALVEHLELENTVKFLGRVNIAEYLGKIDLIALTSLSEAQPLVILEAGAAGVPTIADDVGACSEMIYGQPEENPPLGAGGIVVPVAHPAATAEAMVALLSDRDRLARCAAAIRERVRTVYNKKTINAFYNHLYETASRAENGERFILPHLVQDGE
jgi:glycosyltransferase involved in cell wall biosynthesis